MPSQNIVRDIRVLIQNQLLPGVTPYWREQLWFGLQAYGLRAFQSAAGNARQVVANAHTAARKTERLFQNQALTDQLATVFDTLGLVRPGSYVNCDHSDMNGLAAFVGAIQTRHGRALPCLVEATYSDRLPGSPDAPPRKRALRKAWTSERQHQSFTGHYIDALQTMRERLGFRPKPVFDRGFGNESLVTHLAAGGATFYVRLKAGRFVQLDGERTEVKQLKEKDTTIRLYGLTLRVIRSPKSRRAKEPWYILTNDFSSSRNKVVKIYYHRFEIEETFKDVKHIFELKRTRLNKPQQPQAHSVAGQSRHCLALQNDQSYQNPNQTYEPQETNFLAPPGLRTITAGLRPAGLGRRVRCGGGSEANVLRIDSNMM